MGLNFVKGLILGDLFLPFPKMNFGPVVAGTSSFKSLSQGVSSLANYHDPALYGGPESIFLIEEVVSMISAELEKGERIF